MEQIFYGLKRRLGDKRSVPLLLAISVWVIFQSAISFHTFNSNKKSCAEHNVVYIEHNIPIFNRQLWINFFLFSEFRDVAPCLKAVLLDDALFQLRSYKLQANPIAGPTNILYRCLDRSE